MLVSWASWNIHDRSGMNDHTLLRIWWFLKNSLVLNLVKEHSVYSVAKLWMTRTRMLRGCQWPWWRARPHWWRRPLVHCSGSGPPADGGTESRDPGSATPALGPASQPEPERRGANSFWGFKKLYLKNKGTLVVWQTQSYVKLVQNRCLPSPDSCSPACFIYFLICCCCC